MIINRGKAVKVFDEYVQGYNKNDEKIKLKISHTYRVAMLCKKIAENLNLSQNDVDIAWLSGILHDIGRFEQVRIYGTFNDAISINHAALGCEILFDKGKIRSIIEDKSEDRLLRDVIINHNLHKIDEGLLERTKIFCNILRDADIIDILKANVLHPLEAVCNVTTEEILNTEISREVMDNFKAEDTILRSLKRTAADNVVGHISLVFGLTYPCSIRIAKEQGDIYQLLKFQSLNQKTNEQFEEIKEITHRYLNSRNI